MADTSRSKGFSAQSPYQPERWRAACPVPESTSEHWVTEASPAVGASTFHALPDGLSGSLRPASQPHIVPSARARDSSRGGSTRSGSGSGPAPHPVSAPAALAIRTAVRNDSGEASLSTPCVYTLVTRRRLRPSESRPRPGHSWTITGPNFP